MGMGCGPQERRWGGDGQEGNMEMYGPGIGEVTPASGTVSPSLQPKQLSVTLSKTQSEDWQVGRGLGTTLGIKWETPKRA